MSLKAGFWTAGTEGTAARMNNSMLQLADALVDLPAASSSLANVCYYVSGVGIYQCQYSGGTYSWVLLTNHKGAATLDQNTHVQSSIAGDTYSSVSTYNKTLTVPAGGDYDLVSITQTYDSSSLALLAGYAFIYCATINSIKVRLYADGVQKAESGYISAGSTAPTFVTLVSYASLLGSKIVKLSAHNYSGGDLAIICPAHPITPYPLIAGVHAGSVKVV